MLMRHAGTRVLSGVYEMVDRRGYAPRTAGCKPADLLTPPARGSERGSLHECAARRARRAGASEANLTAR